MRAAATEYAIGVMREHTGLANIERVSKIYRQVKDGLPSNNYSRARDFYVAACRLIDLVPRSQKLCVDPMIGGFGHMIVSATHSRAITIRFNQIKWMICCGLESLAGVKADRNHSILLISNDQLRDWVKIRLPGIFVITEYQITLTYFAYLLKTARGLDQCRAIKAISATSTREEANCSGRSSHEYAKRYSCAKE